jgi:aquaglyceroporin related protein
MIEHTKLGEDAYLTVHPPDKPIASTLGVSVSSDGNEPVQPQLLWSKVRRYLHEASSEFFGTMILVLFGDGVVAQVLLSHNEKGDYQSISWGWG